MLNYVLRALLTPFNLISGTHSVQSMMVSRQSMVIVFLLVCISPNGLCAHKCLVADCHNIGTNLIFTANITVLSPSNPR